MLLIAGRRITSPDDEDITAVFGLSYEQDRNVADIIDWCIEDHNYHYFGGPEAFRSYVMGSVTTGGHLKILCTHSRYHSAYTITMSGSRSEDAKRANAKAGLHGTPSGYTWHHAAIAAKCTSSRRPTITATPTAAAWPSMSAIPARPIHEAKKG